MLTWKQMADKINSLEAQHPTIALRINLQRDFVVVQGLGIGDRQKTIFVTLEEAENEIAIDNALARVVQDLVK